MRFFNTIYLLLLVYTISALVFWGYSLNKQSRIIFEQEVVHLRSVVDSVANPTLYQQQMAEFEEKRERRKKQYLGEGSTFLLVIFIGAAVVYSSFQRSIRLSKQQNNFMLSVTHELKSPLAAIKLNLQTLEKYQLDEDKRNLLIEKCIKESNRLNDLCNNLLLASRMEGGQYQHTRERIDLRELTDRTVKDYSLIYPGRFAASIKDETTFVIGDRLMLQMALTNLMENALKYAPSDSVTNVSLETSGKRALLKVADAGTGIPDQEKNKVFRKFYRLGDENTRKTKGTGLGLYLTKRIVLEHRGRVTITDNVPKGSVFEISLPVVNG